MIAASPGGAAARAAAAGGAPARASAAESGAGTGSGFAALLGGASPAATPAAPAGPAAGEAAATAEEAEREAEPFEPLPPAGLPPLPSALPPWLRLAPVAQAAPPAEVTLAPDAQAAAAAVLPAPVATAGTVPPASVDAHSRERLRALPPAPNGPAEPPALAASEDVARPAEAPPAEAAATPAGSFEPAPALVSGLLAETRGGLAPAPPLAAAPPGFEAPLAADAGLSEALHERIVWQLDEGLGEAQIELHPAELGALTVRIETVGDEARVQIVAAEAATRALLSQALPQLRELLNQAGLSLGRAEVQNGSARSLRDPAAAGDAGARGGARRRISSLLLVDAWA